MDDKLNYIEWLREFADYIEHGDFDCAYLCNMLDAGRAVLSTSSDNRIAYEQFARPHPKYAKRVLAEVAKLGDHPKHGIGESLCVRYDLVPTYDMLRDNSLRVRFLRELADTEAAKAHSPELIRACHAAKAWLQEEGNGAYWLCFWANEVAALSEGAAMLSALDSVLDGSIWAFLPKCLEELGLIEPCCGADTGLHWRLDARLWWLNQILNGRPVPGAAECKH